VVYEPISWRITTAPRPQANANSFSVSLDALDIALQSEHHRPCFLLALNYYDHSHSTGGSGASKVGAVSGPDSDIANVPGKFLNIIDATTGNTVTRGRLGNAALAGGSYTKNYIVHEL